MNLFRFDTESLWIDGIVRFWRDLLRINPRLRMCLTSGNTPLKAYDAMAEACRQGEVSFSQAEAFALDDYGGLAPDDPGRCANMVRRHLTNHIDLPQLKFHTIDTDAPDLDRVCREYDQRIGSGFDLAILGIGLNGHLGLNEPGSDPESTTRRVDLHPSTIQSSQNYLAHSHLPTWGIGVGLKHLLSSQEVWLLANGPQKAEILKRMLQGPITPDLPASLLRHHPRVYLFVDHAAGALL